MIRGTLKLPQIAQLCHRLVPERTIVGYKSTLVDEVRRPSDRLKPTMHCHKQGAILGITSPRAAAN